MEITRYYEPRDINCLLIPNLLERARASIPESEMRNGSGKLEAVTKFKVETFSQMVSTESADDFQNFVRQTKERPLKVTATILCYSVPGIIASYVVSPPYFRFSWQDSKDQEISIWRTHSGIAIPLLTDFEESLQLIPARPWEGDVKKAVQELSRSVFLAHAFDDFGRSYAYQLTKFLSLLSFEVATGEGFSPESVSAKVRRRLSAQELVIVIVSEKQDHTWLVQEAAGAHFAGKSIIVLLEEGVGFKPGILGDIEYISFRKQGISECFAPILEGLRELGFNFS